ncbi:MAG: urease accessory protein [Rhodoglobus sp.]|nr:urease accessory protein [Rhodoglobus sp.]
MSAADHRARLDLRAGAIVPREIERTEATARVALVAGGALLLGGDEVHIDVTVGAGCTLELQDIGGTVAYAADGVRSSWSVDVTIDVGGTLLWSGMPLVVATGAAVERSLRVDLAAGARAFLRETIVLGRSFERGGTARLRTDTWLEGEPLFVEELSVAGDRPVPGVIGHNRVLDSILVLGTRVPPPGIAPANHFEFEGAGCLTRTLGRELHRESLDVAWAQVIASVPQLDPV